MNYACIIVAAGSGSRMGLGYNKVLYRMKNHKYVIEKTVSIFKNDKYCKQIILVIRQEDEHLMQKIFHKNEVEFVYGGDTRQQSVCNGLQICKEEYVWIHDGARPNVSKECMERLHIKMSNCKACFLSVPVKDTIRQCENGVVKQTLPRESLRQAQTPQVFYTQLIRSCYDLLNKKNIIVTDDVSAVELGSDERIYEVQGSYDNIKITTIEDLQYLE